MKYLGIYWWTMKYFWKFLMDNKIFLCGICSFLFWTFSKFVWKCKWAWAENVQYGYQEDFRKVRHVKQQTQFFNYIIANGSKVSKFIFWCILTLLQVFLILVMAYKVHFLTPIFFSRLYVSHSILFKDSLGW